MEKQFKWKKGKLPRPTRARSLWIIPLFLASLSFSELCGAWVEEDDGFEFTVKIDKPGEDLTEADKITYCSVMEEASRYLWEATNGSHLLHTTHFYNNVDPPGSGAGSKIDITWKSNNCVPVYNWGDDTIHMCDYVPPCRPRWYERSGFGPDIEAYCKDPGFTCVLDNGCDCGTGDYPFGDCPVSEKIRYSQCEDAAGNPSMFSTADHGWSIFHEIGHYIYGLDDEAISSESSCSVNVFDQIEWFYAVCVGNDHNDGTEYTSAMGKWGRKHFCDEHTHLDIAVMVDEAGDIIMDVDGDPYEVDLSDSVHEAGSAWDEMFLIENNFDHEFDYDPDVGYASVPAYPSGFSCTWSDPGGAGPSQDALMLLDRSGSMGYQHPSINDGPTALESAANAAISYFNQAQEDRMVGITAFNWEHDPVVPYEEKGTRHLTTLGLFDDGSTDICEAITEGAIDIVEAYTAAGATDHMGTLILLSDGLPTTGNCDEGWQVLEAAQTACAMGVSVSTVPYGEADHELLQDIADSCTGNKGRMLTLPVEEIEDENGDLKVMTTPLKIQTGLVRQGRHHRSYLEVLAEERELHLTNEEQFEIPHGTTELVIEWSGDGFIYPTVVVYSTGGDPPNCTFDNLVFELERPGGGIVTTGVSPIADESDYLTKTIRVENPEQGPWTARIIPQSDYICLADYPDEREWGDYNPRISTVASMRNTTFAPTMGLETKIAGKNMPVPIRAQLSMYPNTRLTNISAVAKVSHKDFIDNVTLYDDGVHGDELAGDGIYGGTFNADGNTLQPGAYNVLVTLSSDEATATPYTVIDPVIGTNAPPSPPMPTITLRQEATLVVRDCIVTPTGNDPNQCIFNTVIPTGGPTATEDSCLFTLTPGQDYDDLHVTTHGLPIGDADVKVNLGIGVEVYDISVIYDPASGQGDISFSASVSSNAADKPRTAIITTYGKTVTSEGCHDTGYVGAGRALFVANGYYAQEDDIENRLVDVWGFEVDIIKDYQMGGATDLSSYNLIVLTGFAPNVYYAGIQNILSSGLPVLVIEYWDFIYSEKLDLVSDSWAFFGNNTLALNDPTHPITQGLSSPFQAYSPSYYAFGVGTWNIESWVTPLVYGPTWGQVSVLLDEGRGIVATGLHETDRYTAQSWEIFDRLVSYLTI
ncbi:MAG: VWA domain-containing protein [Deltaproteobacteria bacterium]|nr:VWA domain-containing protein [Deltaproteobacteria bacterium]